MRTPSVLFDGNPVSPKDVTYRSLRFNRPAEEESPAPFSIRLESQVLVRLLDEWYQDIVRDASIFGATDDLDDWEQELVAAGWPPLPIVLERHTEAGLALMLDATPEILAGVFGANPNDAPYVVVGMTNARITGGDFELVGRAVRSYPRRRLGSTRDK